MGNRLTHHISGNVEKVKVFLLWFIVDLKLLDLHFMHRFMYVLLDELET